MLLRKWLCGHNCWVHRKTLHNYPLTSSILFDAFLSVIHDVEWRIPCKHKFNGWKCFWRMGQFISWPAVPVGPVMRFSTRAIRECRTLLRLYRSCCWIRGHKPWLSQEVVSCFPCSNTADISSERSYSPVHVWSEFNTRLGMIWFLPNQSSHHFAHRALGNWTVP